jgi:hypothetical protein
MFVMAPGRGWTPVVPALRRSGAARGGGPDAHLPGDAAHRAKPLTPLAGRLEHHPDGSLSELGRVSALERAAAVFCQVSIFLQTMESPPKSGLTMLFMMPSLCSTMR